MKFFINVAFAVSLIAAAGPVLHAKAVRDETGAITLSESNTLKGVAEDINDPQLFSYDPGSRTAVCRGPLVVGDAASLTIGGSGEAAIPETLVMMVAKGRLHGVEDGVKVNGKGSLRLLNGRIASASGHAYRLYVLGELVMEKSKAGGADLIQIGDAKEGWKRVRIRDSGIDVPMDSTGLMLRFPVAADIEGLSITGNGGNYSSGIFHNDSSSIKICDLRVSNVAFPVRVAYGGADTSVTLLDPAADVAKIAFDKNKDPRFQTKTSVIVTRSVGIEVAGKDGNPLPGAQVLLVASDSSGAVLTEQELDKSGKCRIEAPERKLSSSANSPVCQSYKWDAFIKTGADKKLVKSGWTPLEKSCLRYVRNDDGGFTESPGSSMPDKQQSAQANNLVRNSSFEVAANAGEGEYSGMPDYWTTSWEDEGRQDQKIAGCGLRDGGFFGIDATTAFHGRQSLKVRIPASGGCISLKQQIFFTMIGQRGGSGDLPESGTPYVFSIYMKSDTPGLPVYYGNEKRELSEKWERYSFVTPKVSNILYLRAKDVKGDGATVWFDAAQVEQGQQALPYRCAVQDLSSAKPEKSSFNPALLARRGVPSLTVKRSAAAPVMDGKLDDSCWAEAEIIPDFITLDASRFSQEKTSCRLLCNGDNLYIGMRCQDPDIVKTLAAAETHGKDVFKGDCVEIFLDPNHDLKNYYHLAVGPLGARYAKAFGNTPKEWNCDWQVKTAHDSGSWTVEIAIPLKDILAANKGRTIGLNLCRTITTGDKNSCWSATYGSFHNPAKFGLVKIGTEQAEELPAADSIAAPLKQEIVPASPSQMADSTAARFFPIGLYGPPKEEDLKEVRDKGFNCVILLHYTFWFCGGERGPLDMKAVKSYLDAAQKNGLGVFIDLSNTYFNGWKKLRKTPAELQEQTDAVKLIVETFKTHPALWGWYSADEPAGADWVKKVGAVYALVKQLDPDHVVWLVNADPKPTAEFSAINDVVSVDPYPVPRLPITLVGEYADTALTLTNHKKPLWIVLQAFSGDIWAREPTPDEESCMAYMAVVHHAKGIWQYSHKPVYVPLWNRIGAVNAELRQLAPVILAPDVRQDVKPATANSPIHCLQKSHGGKTYLITVNTIESPLEETFDLGRGAAVRSVKVLFEDRTIKIEDGRLKDNFGGYARHVYEIE